MLQKRKPYGYKDLLVYKKAEELQQGCAIYTATFSKKKTLIALADQMDRSARSVKQNIVEGWKRNTTKEYLNFLGFSIGACAELEEDCNDIWKGIYKDLIFSTSFDIEQLPFYPLDRTLPEVVQLKLRCKELNYLLSELQKSLNNKIIKEGNLTSRDKLDLMKKREGEEKEWEENMLKNYGVKKRE